MSTVEAYIKKAIEYAEQAVTEDKEKNYEAAVQHYVSAGNWLLQALKCGTISEEYKQMIESKAANYIKRADDLQTILKNDLVNNKDVVDTTKAHENSIDSKSNNDDGASDENQIMQKFEQAIVTDSKISFADVIGLEQAKEALKQALILPVKFPDLFQGRRKPRVGILFYGPPGVGKTYLANAIASECKCPFISVHSSDFMSQRCGNNERNVKNLFVFAREKQPCILFIDDLEVLFSQHNDTEGEWLRRVKTEFLVQMQGIRYSDTSIYILGATNRPWALDAAIRRRFEKRIYIPLPGLNERVDMFKTDLSTNSTHTINDDEWMEIAKTADGYSCADILVVCREALLTPIRKLMSATHFKRIPNSKSDGPRELWLVCSPGDPAAVPMTLDQIKPEELYEPPVTMSDVLAALATQKPTLGEEELKKHMQFTEEYNQDG